MIHCQECSFESPRQTVPGAAPTTAPIVVPLVGPQWGRGLRTRGGRAIFFTSSSRIGSLSVVRTTDVSGEERRMRI
ncbi:hypothetical protein U1Q18_002723 [Sarracenia purpurea var. burkii]